MDHSERIIADALLSGDHETGLAKSALLYAVQRQIMCRYCGKLLDVRDSVLLDGSEHGGGMHLLHSEEYDTFMSRVGGQAQLESAFGHGVEIYDGRTLFA